MTTNIDVPPATTMHTGRNSQTVTSRATIVAPSKSDTVIKMLLRTKGATPVELIAATDWQPHSVRAFLSGLRKKGRTIAREARKSGEFAYRIVIAPQPTAMPALPTVPAAQTGRDHLAVTGGETPADATAA